MKVANKAGNKRVGENRRIEINSQSINKIGICGTHRPFARQRNVSAPVCGISSCPPKEAGTELGREIQRRTDAPSVMVNRIVRRVAAQVLQSEAGEGEKPN